MTEARRLLVEADREAVGESHIGKVFAHARVDEDGTWPTLPVRNMIEEIGSTHLESGLCTGTINSRGITSRGLDEGGDQERRLADDYDRWANMIADQWPRTAAALRSLADRYRAEGRTHDEEARRFRAGLDR
jgi:benzoyl-CoA reductase/2-hydroxyglutaryl-CoA dehydratase subunit BcrC/BadD/HgdB